MNAIVEYGKIAKLEAELRKLPQLNITLRHHFAHGLYAREGTIPAGSCFVGRIHKQSQVNIISQGSISVLTENGIVRMTAPCTMVSPAGAQRAAYAHEDTVWTTILGTEITDPEEAFAELTSATFDQFEIACQELLKLTEAKCT